MRSLPLLPILALVLAPVSGHAAKRVEHARAKPAAPKALGRYDDWVAATHLEAGHTTCYAFTYGHSARDSHARPVLTITERPASRDAVAISTSFSYPANASVEVQVGSTKLDFYTAQHSAFARDSAAAVAAFRAGREAVANGPGPHRGEMTDTFSLRGFSAAYAAINRVCPK